ncbi:MAG: hypothetical protein IJZ80_10180 [Clostridia bacterium]|nr:hypothetical protein [Clostridia bacterium]
MKRALCLLLIWSMLALILVGCSKSDPPDHTEETAPNEETTTSAFDEWGRPYVGDGVPRTFDFGNEEITFLLREGENFRYEWVMEEVNDAVDEAVFDRNAYVSEQLGVVFNYEYLPCNESGASGTAVFDAAIINDRSADLGNYDFVSHFAGFGASVALMECYVNLLDTEKLPYLDLSKPWWNENHQKACTINGQLYFAVGSLNLSLLDRLNVIYYNMTLAEAYGLPNMYELVLNGEWTYEKLYEYACTYYEDRDNDQKKSNADFYAVGGPMWTNSYDQYIQGFKQSIVTENEDGTHIVRDEGLDIWESATDKIYALFNAEGSFLNMEGIISESEDKIVEMFANRQLLFAHQVVSHNFTHNALYRDMEDDFGILPTPKYDAEQQEYGSNVGDCYNIVSIPSYSKVDGKMLSAVMELLYAESYRDVYPYYFERVMKTRYVKTEDSSMVFDLILAQADFDFGQIYAVALDDMIQKLWREPCYYDNISIPRLLLSYKNGLNKKLESLDKWFGILN